jgi:RNA polymerase sigma-70 factor, ECF subfamily
MSNPAASFAPYRRRLLGLAYRMLGSMADAEDAVQETYLRWHTADRDNVSDPRAFLMTTTTRICLDMLTSARARHEEYVGPWLPEPVVDTTALAPDRRTELAEDLSVALLLTLDRLSQPPAHAGTCARRDHAARPPRRRVRARSMRNMRSSCPHSSPPRARAISMR